MRDETMSRPNDYYIYFIGLLGLSLGILLAKPKRLGDALFAVIAGLFAALVIAPMVAEILTSLSAYSYFAWMKATPETSLYAGIIGLCSLLGYQIVIALKDNFIEAIRRAAFRYLKLKDENDQPS